MLAMAPAARFGPLRGWHARLRLASGQILFAFLVTHYLNHALGLVSLDAMEAGRRVFLLVWRNPLGTAALYGALALHLGLVLWSLYRRRGLRFSPPELVQTLFGLSIPPLLAIHILGTRVSADLLGQNDAYALVLLTLWPEGAARQTLLLAVAWVHGCIGIQRWLRLKPGFPAWAPLLFAGALLLPVLAFLGFAAGAREARALLAGDPTWWPALVDSVNLASTEAQGRIYAAERWVLAGLAALAGVVLLARGGRMLLERRRGMVRLRYPDRQIAVMPGVTVLEASRLNGVPHASVCGGRGRCSTCRVRIDEGLDSLPPPGAEERRVLERVAAAPNVRLACQIRPLRDLAVTPLLPPQSGPRAGWARPAHIQGAEREIAVLFADLRGFTQFSESRLPYDVVFVLNQYFRVMGQAVRGSGGHVDKFIGDGVMALFGVEGGAQAGSRQALAAAREMGAALARLNHSLDHVLPEPLHMGVAVHVGPAIVGEMGDGAATSLTAVGDTVNVASRLEALTKEYRAELVVSERVAELARVDLSGFPLREIALRGRTGVLEIRVIERIDSLPGDPTR